jgi:hypothetical protein
MGAVTKTAMSNSDSLSVGMALHLIKHAAPSITKEIAAERMKEFPSTKPVLRSLETAFSTPLTVIYIKIWRQSAVVLTASRTYLLVITEKASGNIDA